jgi:hypothetical protein
MKTSENITKITEALFRFQSICESPKKDSYNPHFKSKYASLESVMNAVVPALRETGLLLLQDPVREGNSIGVKTRIIHKSGEWIEFEPVIVAAGKQDGHGVGSALTYARRYAISTAFGLATEDDDGNAAANPQTKQQPKQQAQRRQQQVRQETQQLAHQRQTQQKTAQQTATQASNRYARLFAIANKRKLSDKAIKGLVYYYFAKTSRKDLSGEELNQLCNMIESATAEQLMQDLSQAAESYRNKQQNNVVPMQQTKTTKGQSAPLTDEEIDRLFGV